MKYEEAEKELEGIAGVGGFFELKRERDFGTNFYTASADPECIKGNRVFTVVYQETNPGTGFAGVMQMLKLDIASAMGG